MLIKYIIRIFEKTKFYKKTIMKRIIGLCGKGNIGKTETLNLLIDLLTVATTGCAMPAPQPAGRNREMTFIYKGNTISICTAGDTEAILKDNCAYFSKMKCDIAISAARSRGKTHMELENLDPSVSVEWIRKIDDRSKNLQIAQDIFNSL